MKNTFALLALAASLGEVTATFRHAQPFKCPDGINNSCFDKQKGGFEFGELIPGKFDKYNDFDFKGWSCESKTPTKKIIKGECGRTKEESPSFGHPENPFSVDIIDVTPEIDCDLEFHYDMPDGSSCKQRSWCSKQGSSIKNSQCGGAKKVTVIYPPQKFNIPKNKCKVKVDKIKFGCDKTKYPPPPVVVPPPPVPSPPPSTTLSTVFSSPPVPSLPVESPPPKESEPVSSAPISSPPVSSAPASSAPPVESLPVESSPVESLPVESSPASSAPASSAPASSAPASSAPPKESKPVESSPVESLPVQSSPVVESTTSAAIPEVSEPPVVETTVFQSTSTIFTTSVTTVTDCGPEKPECGGGETPVVVTVTIPETTTVCDVTTTFTRPATPSETPEEEQPEQPTPEQPTPEQPKPEEEEPEKELPCDPVVPRCLVTWLPLVPDCKDNTDSKCFCPSKEYVEKVLECVYAHGETDEIVEKAIKFVQGICADHVPENPAIVTGAESITDVLTVTATPTEGVKYTTVTLDTTLTVPCVTDGVTISESLTTTVIKTTIEVPEVGFTTTASDIVPVVPTPEPVQDGEVDGNKPTLVVAPSSVPVGTGGIPIPSSTGDFPAEAGAGKLTAGVTAAFAVMIAMAAF